jgi:hypothetical protein
MVLTEAMRTPEFRDYMPDDRDIPKLPRQWVINVAYTVIGPGFMEWVDGQVLARNRKLETEQNLTIDMDPAVMAAFLASTAVSSKPPAHLSPTCSLCSEQRCRRPDPQEQVEASQDQCRDPGGQGARAAPAAGAPRPGQEAPAARGPALAGGVPRRAVAGRHPVLRPHDRSRSHPSERGRRAGGGLVGGEGQLQGHPAHLVDEVSLLSLMLATECGDPVVLPITQTGVSLPWGLLSRRQHSSPRRMLHLRRHPCATRSPRSFSCWSAVPNQVVSDGMTAQPHHRAYERLCCLLRH